MTQRNLAEMVGGMQLAGDLLERPSAHVAQIVERVVPRIVEDAAGIDRNSADRLLN